jgi:hypothetical protein
MLWRHGFNLRASILGLYWTNWYWGWELLKVPWLSPCQSSFRQCSVLNHYCTTDPASQDIITTLILSWGFIFDPVLV